MMWKREVRESVDDARRACMDRGALIYGHLGSDTLDIDQYLTLTPEEFQCLRMYAREVHPGTVLDCIWQEHDGEEQYRVRLDWDISSIEEIS